MPTTEKSAPKTPNIPKQSFVSRNLVSVVMIPGIILLHLGWAVLQNNRKLVSEAEQFELPIITFARYSWKRLMGGSSPAEKVPTVSPSK